MRHAAIKVWRRQNELLTLNVMIADSFWLRLRGLLARPPLIVQQSMWIAHCDSVHSFFMRYSIGVVFLDTSGVVVKIVGCLRPWRMSFCFTAASVLEFHSSADALALLMPGDRIEWLN
ncbi:MAG: uncharacterized membrane protein (UPF0127 family) [Bacteroidia bacterium]